jgi:hypothetical protein
MSYFVPDHLLAPPSYPPPASGGGIRWGISIVKENSISSEKVNEKGSRGQVAKESRELIRYWSSHRLLNPIILDPL